MDTVESFLLFGPRDDPGVDVVLPQSLVSREHHVYHVGGNMRMRLITILEDRRCALNIIAPRGTEHSSWWTIWGGTYIAEYSNLQSSTPLDNPTIPLKES